MTDQENVSLALLQREVERLRQQEPLKSGGGGGTFDGMEARIKRLEDDSKEMRTDLKAIRIDLAEIKGKIANMPTVWTIWQTNAALLATVVAVALGTVALLKNFGII